MRATRRGALRLLPTASTGQRRRSRVDATDRRAVHGLAVPGLAADGSDAAGGGAGDQSQADAATDAPDGHCGAGAEAAHDEARTGAQDLPVSAAEHGDRPAEPGVGG